MKSLRACVKGGTLLVNGGLCGRTFGVYQSSHLIDIQFLIGYRVDSLIIEL